MSNFVTSMLLPRPFNTYDTCLAIRIYSLSFPSAFTISEKSIVSLWPHSHFQLKDVYMRCFHPAPEVVKQMIHALLSSVLNFLFNLRSPYLNKLCMCLSLYLGYMPFLMDLYIRYFHVPEAVQQMIHLPRSDATATLKGHCQCMTNSFLEDFVVAL